MFSCSLGIKLCIDGVCTITRVFDDITMPIPVCHTNITTLTLPGDGSIQGFVRELKRNIGDSAIDIVLEKLGLSVCFIELLLNSFCRTVIIFLIIVTYTGLYPTILIAITLFYSFNYNMFVD